MMFLSIRRIGIILVIVGIGLIGFLGMFQQELGAISFPFVSEINAGVATWTLGLVAKTDSWWNAKIWGFLIGALGLALLKYG